MRQAGLGQHKVGRQVDVNNFIPALQAEGVDVGREGDPGVADEDVQAAEFGDGLTHAGGDLAGVGEVEAEDLQRFACT